MNTGNSSKQERANKEILHATYAGFWKRMLAHNIDLLPILGISYLISFFIPKTEYDMLFLGITYLAYHVLFEASEWQATPGKRWTGLSVVNKKGRHTHVFQAIIRNAAKPLSLLLFFLGFVMISFNPQRRALHDYIAGTLVLLR